MKPQYSAEQLAYLKQAVDYLQKELGKRELEAEEDGNSQRCIAFMDAQIMVREVFDGLKKN